MASLAPDTSPSPSGLSAFVPQYLRQAAADPDARLDQPSREHGYGALLFVDISGFTAMTESLAEQGPRGAERMSELLNRHYGRLVDHIDDFHGDVVAFSGDAVIAVWWTREHDGLGAALRAAALCALQVQRESTGADDPRIRLSIGAGELWRLQLGGIAGRWCWLVSGDPIGQVGQLDALGRTGQILLSAPAAALLGPAAFDELSPGAFRLTAVDAGQPAGPTSSPGRAGAEGSSVQAAGAPLRAFTPDVVAERLAAGQDAFLAEYRSVTVAFVKFDDLDHATPLAVLQQTATGVQRILERYGGQLYQCLHDDKGLIFVLAFGMPASAHERDAERALLAALDIRTSLASATTSIGIASGRVFCGAYGGRTRKQYSLVGNTINRAARLMTSTAGGILCDQASVEAAGSHLAFDSRPAIRIKGRAQPLAVFVPLGRRQRTEQDLPVRLVGRAAELDILVEELERLATGSRSNPAWTTLIEAEAGLGKSTLVQAAVVRARDLGIRVLVGRADAIDSGTSYYPFREILETLIGSTHPELPADLLQHSDLEPLLPLLHTVLPDIRLPGHNETTRSLKGSARLEKTNLLILDLLARGTRGSPALFVIEDCHWIDSASWSLIMRLAGTLPGTGLLLTSRPMENPPPEYRALLGDAGLRHMQLRTLDDDALRMLVTASLGVRTLPEALSELLLTRAEGNPFYAQELAYSLRDSGRIVVRDGRVHATSDAAFDTGSVPENLQGVITQRIDLLDPPVQLTAKVASVIGRGFDSTMLDAVYPSLLAGDAQARQAQIAAHLKALVAADLVVADDRQGHLFRHAITRDTVYALLSYSQRRALNAGAARHLEAHHHQARASLLPRLAHHYAEAEMPAEAMTTLREAGAHAVATFANREAVGFLGRALEFEAAAPSPFERVDRISIQTEMSMAHYALTDYERTLLHAWRALREAGHKRPDRGHTLPHGFLTYGAHRVMERWRGRRATAYAGVRRQEQLSAMRALGSAMPALMLLGREAEYLEAALQLHNLGARLEPSAESGASRCALGFCFAMIGWKRSAEAMLRRGVQECAASGDQENLVQAQMVLGMYLQMRGRLLEAQAVMQAAMDLLEQSPVPGVWHHRGKLQLAAVQDALGVLDVAEQTFAAGGALARRMEPQVGGLFNALRGISLMRDGRLEEAARLIADGETHARDHDSSLHVFAALGGLAELELRRGNRAQALTAATEAMRISERGGEVNSYVHGLHGYSGTLMVCCDQLLIAEAYPSGPSPADIGNSAKRVSLAFGRFARRFEVARPRQLALEGLRLHAAGRAKGAAKCWRQAISLAERMHQPFDRRLATYYLDHAARGADLRAVGE